MIERLWLLPPRDLDAQDTVLVVGIDLIRHDIGRQAEAALELTVGTLDADEVVFLVLDFLLFLSRKSQHVVVQRDIDFVFGDTGSSA